MKIDFTIHRFIESVFNRPLLLPTSPFTFFSVQKILMVKVTLKCPNFCHFKAIYKLKEFKFEFKLQL